MTDSDPDDALVDALVEHARRRRDDERTYAARVEAAGDPADAAALAADDPDRYARHRPYTAAEDDALLAAALGAVTARTSAADAAAADAPPDPAPSDPAPTPLADVARPTPPRRRMLTLILAPIAVAALVLLWPAPAPELPGYRLEDRSGDRLVRVDESARVVRAGARLRLLLRPATRFDAPVTAAAWTLDGGGAHPLPWRFEAAPGGALRLDAPVDALLPGRVGPVTLLVAVGPPAALAALDPTAPPDGVRVLRHRLDIQPATP